MSYDQFYLIFSENIFLGLSVCITLVLFVLFLFRKYVYSIFDPMFFHIVFSASGYGIVFFLYLLDYVRNYYLYSFILTQSAYFLGFFTIKPIKPIKNNAMIESNEPLQLNLTSRMKFLYLFSLFLYFFSNLIIYSIKGIPLFMETEQAVGEGGFGVFIRTINVTFIVLSVIFLYKVLIIKRYSIFDMVVLVFLLLFSSLSKSKATFLEIIFVAFYIGIFSWRFGLNVNKIIRKFSILLFVLAIIAAIVVASIRMPHSNPLLTLSMRVVYTGDIYMMAYPYDNLANLHIHNGNFFMGVFGWLLAGMKLIPWNEVPKLIGSALVQYIYNAEIPGAPNSRHNVFGLYYLGFWGSIPFSFILGFIASYIRNRVYYKVKRNLEGLVIYILLAISCFSLEADVPYAVFVYSSIVFIFLLIYFVAYVLSEGIKTKL